MRIWRWFIGLFSRKSEDKPAPEENTGHNPPLPRSPPPRPLVEPPPKDPPITTPDVERVGILQEITLLTNDFFPYGGEEVIDAAAFRTFDSSDNSYHNLTSGGSWDPDWDMTRVDIHKEEGVRGPVDDNFLRIRLRGDQDYGPINGGGYNKPRNNLQFAPGGNSQRYPDDREFWFSKTWYFPADYEADISPDGNQEVLLQWHNAAGGSGHGNMQLGGNGSEQGRLNINLQINDKSDSPSGKNEHNEAHIPIDDIKGQFVTFVYNCRFNGLSKKTKLTSKMGRHPQVGEIFEGNKGKFNVWMTVPAGATVTSNTLGSVKNKGATRMMKVCERNNEPVGLIPSWRNGVPGQNPLLPALYIYKGRWMDQIKFADRPSIPHSHSSKKGPIVLYVGQIRMGDETSNYQSVHPLKEAQP